MLRATELRATDRSGFILVVEDELVIRELVCEVLESEGFTTQAEENADCALDFLNRQSGNVSLLLTDVNMPGRMNGADLARTSTRLWPSIPIVMMSGFETRESAGVGQHTMFMRKPFSMDEMLSRVRSALAGQALIQ
jgi:DNA-binding response OmpR family regulator